ncbi:unnamed protein product [Periconia digitata]|uniref:WD40 repeat-like protein n=1 Tax=Periconia digitata TaxID=1303443 RepID=A0A9W4XLQ9_9PLEO|nr:unnamed protein product [Periconia digitata]
MENTQVSPRYKTTSLPVPSSTASHIAHLSGSRLQIRSLATFEIVRNIALPPSHDLRNSTLAWSPPAHVPASNSRSTSASTPPRRSRSRAPLLTSHRFLVADDDTIRVYDLRDDKWNAVVSNGSGSMGKNVHVEFGRDENEILVWSAFTSRLVRWCLITGKSIEVRDPKFEGKMGRGWGYRPRRENDGCVDRKGNGKGNVMAVLCRSSGQDILLLLTLPTYAVLKKVDLPTTDAQGLKWSRDGRWLAIWDSAASGYFLHIYTADGHFYRTITREPSVEHNEWGVEGLGIKSVEWVPGNEWLAVGGWDRRVRILSTRTFTPTVYLDHTPEINVPTATVYTESVDSTNTRTYTLTPQPTTPPKPMLEKNETGIMKHGISILSFNKSGTFCATRDDSTPSTIWIWDLVSLKPATILIQHSPVKSLTWHPTDPFSLLIQTTHDSPTLYILSLSLPFRTHSPATSTTTTTTTTTSTLTSQPSPIQPPTIHTLSPSLPKPPSSLPAKWLSRWLAPPLPPSQSMEIKKPALLLAHSTAYIIVWPHGKDQILRFEKEDGADDSDDSLYEILTGRKGGGGLLPLVDDDGDDGEVDWEEAVGSGGEDEEDEVDGGMGFEDTFRGKGGAGAYAYGGRGRSVLGESGLDEMF